MQKIDKTVKNESLYIFLFTVILSVFMQGVCLIVCALSKLSYYYTYITGNLVSALTAVLNFFLMGLTVQKAVGTDEKTAKTRIKFSQTLRNAAMFLIIAVCVLFKEYFNLVTLIVPLFFPRIAIAFRPLLKKGDESLDAESKPEV